MIELKYTFANSTELLAHLTTLGAAPLGAAIGSKAANPTKASKPEPVTLTATQTAAVDDTAGVGNANNPPVKSAGTGPTASATQADAQPKKAETSAPAVEYPTLQKAVFKLAEIATKKLGKDDGKAAVLAVAAAHGAATFKELDPSKYAEALKAVEAKAAELEAPEEAVA